MRNVVMSRVVLAYRDNGDKKFDDSWRLAYRLARYDARNTILNHKLSREGD